jgi:hypothetical protein
LIDLALARDDVRHALVDPAALCESLGLAEGARRQSRGVTIRCPVHGDRTPSCSVTTGPDGTVRVKCFACDFTADAIGLVAAVYGLETRGDGFRETLVECAKLGGLLTLADELAGCPATGPRERVTRPVSCPAPEYTPSSEIEALWSSSAPPSGDPEVSGYLVSRVICPEATTDRGLARAVTSASTLPRWASSGHNHPSLRPRSWLQTGHRLLVRLWDHRGSLRSVRGWRVREGRTPKRLPPYGHRTDGLVMANLPAWRMLRGVACPYELVIVEGEPDFLTWSTRCDDAVIGIISGSWVPTSGAASRFAARVPDGTKVSVRTHNDAAGDRYAQHVIESIGERCAIWRLDP